MKKYVLLAAALGIIPSVVHSRVCEIQTPPGECPNPCIETFNEINELLTNQLQIPGWEVKWQGGGTGKPGSQTDSAKPIPFQPNFATNDPHLKVQQSGGLNKQGECVYNIEFWINPWAKNANSTVGIFSLVQSSPEKGKR